MHIAYIGAASVQQYPAEVVGSKAANLARLAALGLPVPPAFVLPISLCGRIVNGDAAASETLRAGLTEGIKFLEQATGKMFGDRRRPLLVSVRSGAARSLPGMLETVIDVGCTAAAVRGLVRMTGNPKFAADCRRRFLESYGGTVLAIDRAAFTERRNALLATEGVTSGRSFDCDALERLGRAYEQIIEDEGHVLSDDPMEHVTAAAHAVYRSWMSERACTYRKLQHLDDLQGTAVTVQAMVFGNTGTWSGAGVAFSRDPSTGLADPVIDVLFDSQGEDVVSGTQNPETEQALCRLLPNIAERLREVLRELEQVFGDIQDVEFTIENAKLWILQTRSAKRTPRAALRLAVDFVKEGRITPRDALQRLTGLDVHALVEKRLVVSEKPIAYGTGASSGVAVGRAAFDPQSAARLAASGEPVILIRRDIATADVSSFAISMGIITAVGGRTAHAALVARQMGKPCIVGCTALSIDAANHFAKFGDVEVKTADWLSVDGTAGAIYLGRAEVVTERPEAELAEIERWKALAAA